ncbi:unnamed protein product, partial [Mesorhabditis belari]|uniref:WH2 domain-containing protein n=1 Tax=Mesorhabditis belari TaxID=2138241 RepID=A0AAF3EZV9_9BILA
MAWVGHPILDEIKTGIRLKPTKTVDKSAPIIFVDGEKKNRIDRGSCPPPAPPLNSSLAPPAPPVPRASSSSPTVSTLRERKNSAADRGKLLESIRGGVRLRKTMTKDKSAPVLQSEIHQEEPRNSQKQINGYPRSASEESDYNGRSLHDDVYSSTYANDPRKQADFVFQESDLYVTEEKLQKEIPTGKAALGKSIFDSPEQNVSPPSFIPEHQRKLSLNSYLRADPRPAGRPDASFDEAALKVTSEALRREIPAGTASGKIARFANGEVGQTNSLPRIRFKPGQLRSPFHESDTNLAKQPTDEGSGGTLPRAKSPSTGFLTQRIARPLDAEKSRPYSPATQPRSSSISTPPFARNLFDFPNNKTELRDTQQQQQQQQQKLRSPPPSKSSTKPYESIYPQEYERSVSPYKSTQVRSTLVTPAMALGSQSPKITTYRAIPSNNPPVSNGDTKAAERVTSITPKPDPRSATILNSRPQSVTPVFGERVQSLENQRRPQSVTPQRAISHDQWVTVTSPTVKNPLNGGFPRGRAEKDHIVYTVHNGEPKAQPSQPVSQSSPRARSTSRPAWREQNGTPANGYTYTGNPSSSTFTYSQPQQQKPQPVTYTPVNFSPSARQPRNLMHARSASEMSRPIAVRTDFLPSSPLQSIEPSPVSPLRPLEVRDVHTSPMVSTPRKSPFPSNSSSQQSSSSWRNETQQNATRSTRHNGRASSPESSMSSQQSPFIAQSG